MVKVSHGLNHSATDIDIDWIRLWRPSKHSVLDSCLKNATGTLLPQILYMGVSVRLLAKIINVMVSQIWGL